MIRSRTRRYKAPALLTAFVTSLLPAQPCLGAGSFDFGIGLGFVDHRDGFDGGWAYKIGYEFGTAGDFHAGLQWHSVSGVNDRSELALVDDLSFRSNALYATFRPTNAYLGWLQFSTGLVLADYRSSYYDEANNRIVIRDPNPSRTGFALGVGVVLPFADSFRLHLIDYHRYRIGSETFDLYGISVALLY